MNKTVSLLLAAVACSSCAAPPARTALQEATPLPSAPASVPSAAATPSAASVTAADVVAVAPELTAASATLLVERFRNQYTSAEAIAEAGIATASSGFRALEPAVATEAGASLDAAYKTLGPGGRAKVGAYLDHVRTGVVSPEESREGRQLFTDALRRLPETRRARLASLYESAIAAGLKEYAAAQARTLEAQPVGRALVVASGPRVAVGPPASTHGGSIDPAMARMLPKSSSLPTRGEAYWKAEAQGRHERLATLEKDLVAAEAEGARYVYPPKITGQTGFDAPTPDPFYIRREQINKRIAQLKVQIESARKAVLDLEFDCVHDNGLPGWVR